MHASPSHGTRTWDAHGNAFRVRWHVIKYIEYHVIGVSVQGTSPHLHDPVVERLKYYLPIGGGASHASVLPSACCACRIVTSLDTFYFQAIATI
jgi:hypothetical protein